MIDENPQGTEAARGVLAAIGNWLASLTPGTTAYRAKERPSLINSKRRAKGKPPALFDWHTVVIAPPPEPGPPKGGTHASPRLHDRRGHWRTYASGKRGWVKECKVGSPSKGTVTLRATLPEGVIDKVFTLTKSIAGVAGAQGPATYSWIAYANNSSGTVDFTTGAPGSRAYIGIAYNKSTPTESTNPADYEWSLFQGPSGAPGTNGLDGAASVTASSTAASAGAVSEASRNSLFTSNAGRAPKVGDALTLHNQTAKWSQTWVHSGLSWGAATLYIDGNAVITGTLYADTISTSKVVVRPIGAYIGSSIAITSGYLTVTLVTTSAVSTPLWSYAIYVFDNVIATVSWVNNTSTTCTFSIKAWDMTTNTPYTGTIGNIKIWMF
ncbi:MAG TPA: hypothetical protein PLE22_05695 [Acidovorax sp.]|nr:hypothetical protein [Acidovorax sp.]